MRIESKLCHLSETKVVVQVYGWINDRNVGSALGEGSTVDIAEDNAISRLTKRLNIIKENDTNEKHNNDTKMNEKVKVELPKNAKIEASNVIQEPNDWSNELTEIDSEIDRLKWSREDEINFLEKNLGYNNRNKITKYNEIVNYLSILKKIDNNNSSISNKIDLTSMIEESDKILRDLSWDTKKGREYLQKEFNVSTRKELDENQLITFVAKLKSIRNQYLSQ
tara:strand:- start:620 stop:1288 length:669 start_codon:yes stop_codon:yes gene_type:complete